MSDEVLERSLVELGQGWQRWRTIGLAARADLLRRTADTIADAADDWVDTACDIKGLDPRTALAGEEWLAGPYASLWATQSLAGTLDDLADGKSPIRKLPLTDAPGGRRALRVLPRRWSDRLVLSGFDVRLWFPPGVDDEQIRSGAGRSALPGSGVGGIGLVLGAGNVTAIPVLDTLHELFTHHRVVILKLNPITDPMLPVLRRALAPLIEAGVLRIVTGDGKVGAALANHPAVDHVHLTGSAATYRAVVDGLGDRMTPVTAELGGVSPVIVVPGKWSKRDLRFQAEHVATMRLQNNGYNCIAAQALLLSSDWPQRDEFLAELRRALQRAPKRPAYYPGSGDRVGQARDTHAHSEDLDGRVLLPEVIVGDPALTTEYFAPVLAVTQLPGLGADFLRHAVALAEEHLTGSLGANVIIDPITKAAAGRQFDDLIAGLHYGTVAVNAWTAFGFLTPEAVWGAFPDPSWSPLQRDGAVRLDDAGSGIGQVHNTLILDGVERTVVTGPFRPFPRNLAGPGRSLLPKPPWFVTHRRAHVVNRRLVRFLGDRKLWRLPGIFAAALRS